MVRPCGTCGGAGRTITDPCTACTGRGHSTAHQTLEVTVPAGSFDGMQLCVRGEGEGTGGHRGDLFLVVHVATHPFFSRSDDDLLITLPVSYSRAVLGGSVEVPGLQNIQANAQIGYDVPDDINRLLQGIIKLRYAYHASLKESKAYSRGFQYRQAAEVAAEAEAMAEYLSGKPLGRRGLMRQQRP
jgi:hypothetical protein